MILLRWVESDPPDAVAPWLYPQAEHVDYAAGLSIGCRMRLPYPAPGPGYYAITCVDCGRCVVLLTLGRLDDPQSVRLLCKPLEVSCAENRRDRLNGHAESAVAGSRRA